MIELKQTANIHRSEAERQRWFHFILGLLPVTVLAGVISSLSAGWTNLHLPKKEVIITSLGLLKMLIVFLVLHFNWLGGSEAHASVAREFEWLLTKASQIIDDCSPDGLSGVAWEALKQLHMEAGTLTLKAPSLGWAARARLERERDSQLQSLDEDERREMELERLHLLSDQRNQERIHAAEATSKNPGYARAVESALPLPPPSGSIANGTPKTLPLPQQGAPVKRPEVAQSSAGHAAGQGPYSTNGLPPESISFTVENRHMDSERPSSPNPSSPNPAEAIHAPLRLEPSFHTGVRHQGYFDGQDPDSGARDSKPRTVGRSRRQQEWREQQQQEQQQSLTFH